MFRPAGPGSATAATILVAGFGHGVGADDGQADFGQHLLAQFLVGALHAHHQRHLQVHRLAGGDHALAMVSHFMMPPKMLTRMALTLGFLEHDLEGLGDLLGGGAAADVEEVGRLAAEQLDGVHGRHRQAGAVDQAADVAVQADVGEVELAGLDLGRIFFVEVAQATISGWRNSALRRS